MTLSELKKTADKYSWTLSAHTFGHKALGVERKVIRKQTNSIQLEDGSWLEYPKASQCCFFMSSGDLCLSVQIDPERDPKAVMTYVLKPI